MGIDRSIPQFSRKTGLLNRQKAEIASKAARIHVAAFSFLVACLDSEARDFFVCAVIHGAYLPIEASG